MHNSVIERIVEKCQSCEILDQVVAANAHKDISPILKRYITYTIMLWLIALCLINVVCVGDNPFYVPRCMLLCFSAITICDAVRCSACRIWSMRCRPSTWTVLVISILKLGYCKFVVRYMYIIFSCWPCLSFWLHGNYPSLILPFNCYSQDVWCRSVRCWHRRSRRIWTSERPRAMLWEPCAAN